MNIKSNLFYFFAMIISISIFTSCYEDNLDDLTTEIEETEVDVETIDCDSIVVNVIIEDSTLIANILGGTAPYLYEWSSGENTESINLTSDEFSVTITDSNGCIASISGNSGSNNPCDNLTASIVEYPDSSSMETVILDGVVNGGTPPYLYEWSNGQQTPDITVQTSGDYSITVIDAVGCTFTINYTLVINSVDPCTGFSAIIFENPDSAGITILSAVVTGGTAPYVYEWSNGANSSNISPNAPGDYTVTVTDAIGCIITITYNYSDNNDPCLGLSTGINAFPDSMGITILATNTSGGTSPYLYEWTTGETTPNIEIETSGEFGVTVTDAVGCNVSESIEL